MSDAGSTDHLDLEQLADVLAGEAAEHAQSCPECSAKLAALQSAMVPVTASLEALPRPEMPAEVGAALSRAISQERTKLLPGRPVGARSTTVTPSRAKRSVGWRAIGPALAAAAALVLVGVLVFRGDGHPSTTAAKQATTHTLSSGLDYAKDGKQLKAALPGLLSGSLAARATAPLAGAQPAPSGDPLARLRSTPALAQCIAALTDVNDTRPPLALDYASFEGAPALIVLLPSEKPTKVDAWVVGPGCSQADAKVLFFMRLTRPS